MMARFGKMATLFWKLAMVPASCWISDMHIGGTFLFDPTAIVSDFRLPERDGLSILRGLKNYQWCPPRSSS